MKFTEEDIRPRDIQEKFLELAKKDVDTFFSDAQFDSRPCYVCGSALSDAFVKHGFKYSECKPCKSIFVNPRPKIEYFNEYYKNSDSSKYWAESLFEITKENRTRLIWEPRAKRLKNIIEQHAISYNSIVDIGAGYGLFLNVLQKEFKEVRLIGIEPAPHLAKIIRNSGHQVIEKFLEEIEQDDLPKNGKLFVSFEMFEHLHDPDVFLKKIFELMKQKDCFLFTTLSATGLDIRLLWENSESLSPPHHLNFFSPEAMTELLAKYGFKVRMLETPGVLDLDILKKNIPRIKDSYWRYFIESLSSEAANELQEIIVRSKLSSHMMVLVEK
ncbi:class I SAM-dependent methyltransferase [Leptospira biflexa]|uniref:class I SAM-dependent methyltransferase n=1 Tax=Leptospira biflexa TaxID=172 RepID=UPI0010828095|nr:class I SAM-dependent methyltransferase [Leptospira biflexa]TGM31733.1 class I SAM-dependent methyltransferase [Leptospira biflexa]TGM39108.1 class I SAM-dependent methyltransferase [Leptospira biflexa]